MAARGNLVRFAQEGRGILKVVLLVVLISMVGGVLVGSPELKILAVVSLMFLGFAGYFFRDPKRVSPTRGNLILAPADGKVVYSGSIDAEGEPPRSAKQVSIFLSLFNVHTNRVPITGTVTFVHHTKGRFLAAFRSEASEVNERTEIGIQAGKYLVKVRQVAGILARRIVCHLKEGDQVTKGSRLGFILFGSRVDLVVPSEMKLHVGVGDTVKGGETIIGEWT